MALPTLTPEQRDAALEKAARVRKERATVKSRLKTGVLKLPDALDRADIDPVIGKMKAAAFLACLPGVGPATVDSIMTELEISPRRTVHGIGIRQRRALLAHFGFTA